MAANAIDLCLATTVAADLGVASDATVQRVVTAASRAIAVWCGRTFERASGIVEPVKGYGRPYLLVARPPVVSIDSITIGGATVPASEYEVNGTETDAGMILRIHSNWPSYAYGPFSATLKPREEIASSDDIVVTYDGGFVTPGQNSVDPATYPAVTLPEDVQEAAILTACSLYRARGQDQFVASESLGDYSVSYFAAKAEQMGLPPLAQAFLAPYRLLRLA